jgi:hypothetical protein
LIVFVTLYLLFAREPRKWLWALIVWGIFLIVEYLWPFLQVKTKGYTNKMALSYENNRNTEIPLYKLIFDRLERNTLLLIFVLGFVILADYNLGQSNALKQERFLMLDNNTAILRIYDNNVLTKQYDGGTHNFSDSLTIFDLSQITSKALIYRDLEVDK